MTIKIITDSACDIEKTDQQEFNIEIMPVYVVENEKTYRDGIDISSEEVCENMRQGTRYKTSQIPYGDFYKRFEDLILENKPFIYLAFSSGLSGTYQAAALAKRDLREKYPDAVFEVVDTKAVCYGLGHIVYGAARVAAAGCDMETLIKQISYHIDHVKHVFTVTDLQYLYRGGRLNKGTAIIGNMLHINPLLDVNKSGELQQIDKVRGEKKLVKKMVDYLETNGDQLEKQVIGISHADNPELVELFVKMAGKRLNIKRFKIVPLGPTVLTHSGPGTLAVFFFDEWKEAYQF
ncbi:DegV family protein [Acetobacterium sp. KB-1]|jgi:DegV family protein with EDD domain|uniref:DegV family protein n=1 Tax=Acetobacterium sp. KB-1 TaxID=2184575 RepID=UPI000DBEB7E3|nr:DegV family protein [Acetobacterium sp. KB-1]AWW26431.1 DegV family protein [Acetobacterium sp. KB-1]